MKKSFQLLLAVILPIGLILTLVGFITDKTLAAESGWRILFGSHMRDGGIIIMALAVILGLANFAGSPFNSWRLDKFSPAKMILWAACSFLLSIIALIISADIGDWLFVSGMVLAVLGLVLVIAAFVIRGAQPEQTDEWLRAKARLEAKKRQADPPPTSPHAS